MLAFFFIDSQLLSLTLEVDAKKTKANKKKAEEHQQKHAINEYK